MFTFFNRNKSKHTCGSNKLSIQSTGLFIYFTFSQKNHLESMSEIVTALMEQFLEDFIKRSCSSTTLPIENVGCLGVGRIRVSLDNIATIFDMVGRSAASSWTHNKPMCMHFTTSLGEHEFSSDLSINDRAFPSFHSLHAYINFKLFKTSL